MKKVLLMAAIAIACASTGCRVLHKSPGHGHARNCPPAAIPIDDGSRYVEGSSTYREEVNIPGQPPQVKEQSKQWYSGPKGGNPSQQNGTPQGSSVPSATAPTVPTPLSVPTPKFTNPPTPSYPQGPSLGKPLSKVNPPANLPRLGEPVVNAPENLPLLGEPFGIAPDGTIVKARVWIGDIDVTDWNETDRKQYQRTGVIPPRLAPKQLPPNESPTDLPMLPRPAPLPADPFYKAPPKVGERGFERST